MSRIIAKGATSQSIYVEILDSASTSGGRKTGIVYNSAGLTAYYVRNGASATAITLATLAAANSAYSSGGFKEVDATNMPGVYRLDLPDAAVASGADSVVVTVKGASGAAQVSAEIQLSPRVDVDTIKTNPVVNAGTVTFPTTATLASTTNITAGTIATVSGNVTGSVGSVVGAVGSVTGAVGSVTGNVGGNVTGSVGSVAAGGITASSIAADAIGASELAADAVTEIAAAISIPSAATVAAAVWDLDATAHQTQGTFGQAIGDPVADTNSIFKAVVTDATGATVGVDGAAILADTNELQTDWVNGGRLDLILDIIAADTTTDIPALIATLQAFVDTEVAAILAAVDTEVAAIKAKTDSLTFTVANQVDANAIAISGDSVAADRLEAMMDGVIVAQVNDAAASTTVFIADGFTEATNDHFNGRLITFISGALSGQQTAITDYVGATQTITVTALTEAPAENDFFIVH